MTSNATAAMLAKLAPAEAERLADYLDALASQIRIHAKSEMAVTNFENDRKRAIREARAQALEMLRLGMSRSPAVQHAARQFNLTRDIVEANIDHAETLAERKQAEQLQQKIRKLRQQGNSIRQIASKLGLSRSKVHRCLTG